MSGELELGVTRLIAARRATVWHAFTERTAEWWCPKPWTTEIVAWEMRAGGRQALTMRGPAGEEAPQEGVFLEVRPEELVVFTDAFASGWRPRGPFMVGEMRFADEGGGTRYTATARHWTADALERHRAMGFEQGWGAVADQLAEVAEAIARA